MRRDLRELRFRHFVLLCSLTLALCGSFAVQGAQLSCRISAAPEERSVNFECAAIGLPAPSLNRLELRFADEFAGVGHLSERIFSPRIKDAHGHLLSPEIAGPGLYRLPANSPSNFTFSYSLRLARALEPGQYALVSSLGPEAGFLMLFDALPRLCLSDNGARNLVERTHVEFRLPTDWQVATVEMGSLGAGYEVEDAERAVFFIGRTRNQRVRVNQMDLQLVVAGNWSFSDLDAARLVESIAREQATMMAGHESGSYLVTLAPFPQPLTGLRSTALTRGQSVVMLLNAGDGPEATFRHYQKHLAHEMFHYYLPEAFRVRENFDWFWEGFTRYVALRTLLRLHLIGLPDFLDELNREYQAYAANPLRAQLSLVAASAEKFTRAASSDLVYHKGTFVAALYDFELLRQSDGRRDVLGVMRQLYQAGRQSEVGNREVIGGLNQAGDFTRFVRDYVEGVRPIDLAEAVKPYGLAVEPGRNRLAVMSNPSAKQRALLARLDH